MEGPTIIILQGGRVAPSEQLQTSGKTNIHFWVIFLTFWVDFYIFLGGIFWGNFRNFSDGNFSVEFFRELFKKNLGEFFGGGYFLIFWGYFLFLNYLLRKDFWNFYVGDFCVFFIFFGLGRCRLVLILSPSLGYFMLKS